MILNKPLLFLRRLKILSRGAVVYDEIFHEGVNIIRGENGHGKSTISDFIFFVLGGDISSFKPEAERCETIWAEVELNEAIAVFRRVVSDPPVKAVEVFWGAMDSAVAEPFVGWKRYPLARFEEKESFSQIVFRALEFPEVLGGSTSNLTMNQLLRLIYVDQMSSVHSLLREEPFDSPIKRQAVGDLLLGLYDDSVYAAEMRQREVEKEMESANAEYDSLYAALKDTGQIVDLSEVDAKYSQVLEQFGKVTNSLSDYENVEPEIESVSDDQRLNFIQQQLLQAKKEFANVGNGIREIEFELAESSQFVQNLERKLESLDDSIFTELSLGHLSLSSCPECMQVLSPGKDGHCSLCGQLMAPKVREKQLAKLRQELATQVLESQRIIKNKTELYEQSKRELITVTENLRNYQSRFEEIVGRTRSRRDAEIDDLLSTRGRLEGRLEYLANQRKLVAKLEESRTRAKQLNEELADLKNKIERGRRKQMANRELASGAINRYAVEFLKRDLNREEWFKNAQEVKLDFKANFSTVDGRDLFSASSITFLKSAVHFSIFFSSLELPFFRYPKFILNDNIEDKGMEDERSYNLQRIVIEISSRFQVKHQIIMTTSKIAPELDNTPLCVGPSYRGNRKTLNFGKT